MDEYEAPDDDFDGLMHQYLETKDPGIREQVTLKFKGLVELIAEEFLGSGMPLEDLVEEGYIGLITALNVYSADKGMSFPKCAALFIISQLRGVMRDRGKVIREPAWIRELASIPGEPDDL